MQLNPATAHCLFSVITLSLVLQYCSIFVPDMSQSLIVTVIPFKGILCVAIMFPQVFVKAAKISW